MGERIGQLWSSISSDLKELVLHFTLLLFATALLSWLANRRLKPKERGPLVSVPLFLSSFAMLMLARHFGHDRWGAVIIAAGLAIAGFITVKSGTRLPVHVALMLALLLGFGLNLSALVLFAAAFITLFISRPAAK